MYIVIGLIVSAVLIGLPTLLVVRTFKKADESTIVYSPEEVTQRLSKGFFMSHWGIELAFGAIPTFALLFCDVNTIFQFAVPIATLIIGVILLFVGRIKVGLMTRYLSSCNRDRTDLEDWVLERMQGIEVAAMELSGINAISRLTPGVTDDILMLINGKDVIFGYRAVGRVYMGKNILKKHWPIICIALIVIVSVLITIVA